MPSVTLNGANITDDNSFHAECRSAFGFPATYANSMDAWVDCLSYLRDADGMTSFRLKPNEVLDIVIENVAALRLQAPDILEELTFCIHGINERYEDYGEKPALALVLR